MKNSRIFTTVGGRMLGEDIVSGRQGRRSFPRVESPRWLFLAILVVLVVTGGLGRLVDLQIINGAYYKALAEGNRIRRIPVKAPRGEILDRNGMSLARNIPVYKLAEFGTGGVVTKTHEITREEAIEIQAKGEADAARLLVEVKREYPLGSAGAHLIGYVAEVGPDMIGRPPAGCPDAPVLTLGDIIGSIGIEKQYDCVLAGINGEELIEVDTRGRLIRKLGRRDPIPGQSISLSIDAELQRKAYDALLAAPNEEGTRPAREDGITVRGAFVIQSPETGEVLVLVSAPSFDPNNIAKDYSHLVEDQNLPLFNRAIGGGYHPGSTFKIVTAAAGLEEGKIVRDFEYEDVGLIRIGEFVYRNWYLTQYGRTEGLVNVVRALTRSTDTFFYKVGEFVGVDDLAKWARKFGLGQATGIDLPGEGVGLVPDSQWKERVRGERWFLGNTYHMAIGQGDLVTTPLQVNRMTSVVASGGKLCKPGIKIQDIENSEVCKDLGIKKETLEVIKEGMIGACSPGGTAFPFFTFEPRVTCKTGTAETGRDKTHAWLTAYLPDIVATALIEDGGEGSRVAAPVVKEVLEWWASNR